MCGRCGDLPESLWWTRVFKRRSYEMYSPNRAMALDFDRSKGDVLEFTRLQNYVLLTNTGTTGTCEF